MKPNSLRLLWLRRGGPACALIVVLAVLVPSSRPDEPLAPSGVNRHPTDVPKRHIEEILGGRQTYAVWQGGTMDGANCRSPIGVGMMDGPAIEQTWESNRAVRLENVGETDVVNPWLSNGRNAFRTLDEIVAMAVQPGMTDREKAFALWFQEIRHRYHWEGDNAELGTLSRSSTSTDTTPAETIPCAWLASGAGRG
jgi:hypothetical protein